MKLGYSTWGMPRVPIEEAIPRLAEMGYDGIELTVLPAYTTALETLDAVRVGQIRRLLTERDLELPAIAAHSNLLSTDAAEHEANWRRLTGGIDVAVQLAIGDRPPALNTTPGGTPEEWEQIRGLLVDRVGDLAAYGAERDVTVAMEPHVGASIDHPERMLWLVEQVGSPYLGVNMDYSHFQARGWTVEDTVPQLVPHTVHSHVKGVRGVVPDFEFLVPGEDELDYAQYLRVMADAGYDGFQSVEVSYMVQRRADYEPFGLAELAYETLAAAFEAAGIAR